MPSLSEAKNLYRLVVPKTSVQMKTHWHFNVHNYPDYPIIYIGGLRNSFVR